MADQDVLIMPVSTGSYTATLWKAEPRKKAKPGDKNPPMFSVAHLYTAEAMETPEWKVVSAAVTAAAVARFGADKLKTMIEEGKFESPFKRDIKSKGYPETFIRYVTSKSNEEHPPAIVKFVNGKRVMVTDKAEIYPGVQLKVSVAVRAYGGLDTGWDPGVSLDLRNVCKVGDGPRLAGGSGDGSEFGGEAGPAEPVKADEFAGMLD